MASRKPAASKIAINRRALDQRMKRILDRKGQAIRRAGGKDVLIDVVKGVVLDDDCDVEKLAHEVDALKAWEELEKSHG